ncbi:MBOAT family O-acyltransferase [Calditrichota bacterium]
MNFVTVQYLVFVIIVFFIYWHLNRKYQNIFLLIASYYFYACWDWRFLSLIIISTITDFISGQKIFQAKNQKLKRFWLIFSLVVNLGVLGYFKYFNFFADSLITLAQSIGWNLSQTTLHIILPVGISFYTFQTLSYSIDIFRGKLKPTNSIIDFGAFVAFFPQLVAGPIVRAREFIFQLEKKRVFTSDDFQYGLRRFLLGFFKKAFIADTIAVHLVDPVFANPGNYSSITLWIAIIGYSIQIYADFSGYSNMAIGTAKILGFNIPENFNFPYLAKNISDFWRRWHMTMSRFFRDYVYIGLGGNRGTILRTNVNLIITTLISGLWHGAGWTFVIWGGLHGLYTAIYQTFNRWKIKNISQNIHFGFLGSLIGWFFTQSAVLFAWILFRAQDFSSSWIYLKGLFNSTGTNSIEISILVWIAFLSFVFDHIGGWLLENKNILINKVPNLLQAAVYATIIIFLFNARPADINPFIYFQF